MKKLIVVVASVVTLVSVISVVLSQTIEFVSPNEAYRQGMSAHLSGQYDLAVPALEAAEKGGVSEANLVLGRIFKDGLYDDKRAFQFYKKYALQNSGAGHKHYNASEIAEAFNEVGKYLRSGIAGSDISKDAMEAYRYFHHAASNLRSPGAAYNVALMHLSGDGVVKNARTAAKWLKISYKKNHANSQALLGNLFWQGKGVKENKPLALSLLMMARTNAGDENCVGYDPNSQGRIVQSFERINGAVSQTIKAAAQDIYEELYHPCFANIDLPSIDGVRIQTIFKDGGSKLQTDEQPVDKNEHIRPPMTFR